MSKKKLKKRIKELELQLEHQKHERAYWYRAWQRIAYDKSHELPKAVEVNTGWVTPPYEIGSGSIGSDPNSNYTIWLTNKIIEAA